MSSGTADSQNRLEYGPLSSGQNKHSAAIPFISFFIFFGPGPYASISTSSLPLWGHGVKQDSVDCVDLRTYGTVDSVTSEHSPAQPVPYCRNFILPWSER